MMREVLNVFLLLLLFVLMGNMAGEFIAFNIGLRFSLSDTVSIMGWELGIVLIATLLYALFKD